jgi:F0F1-type ATP synthase epsilon subunit
VNCTIISPQDKKECIINWLEVNTSVGNFVMQSGHAPTVLLLSPGKPFVIELSDGKQEVHTVVAGGILEIDRTHATFFVYE